MAKSLEMNDTSPKAEAALRSIIATKTEEERLLMYAEMFETAREFVISSMPKDLSASEQKRYIYSKFYGEPLPDDFLDRFPAEG